MLSLFIAQANSPPAPFIIVTAILMVLFFFSVIMLLVRNYKRCPSNRILVVSGKFTGSPNNVRCYHGGAKMVLPLVQDYAYLSLEPIHIEGPLTGLTSLDEESLTGTATFTVAIGTEPELMKQAASRLLGLQNNDIKRTAAELILPRLRSIIIATPFEDIVKNRKHFEHRLHQALAPELAGIGLVLISININQLESAQKGQRL
jgi:flotillin